MKEYFKNLWKTDGFRIFAYAVGTIFVIAMALSFVPTGNEDVNLVNELPLVIQ